ncbi:MAG: 23S rRNA (guanosine(2251)-2'-O)-methyltransferase RlmB [Elusimicrobia bacterium]|nr:23S rRNA (guanosine(2251)-2'-O)-methyltransferase RlmB [Candidatus Liberimonas magnetica]
MSEIISGRNPVFEALKSQKTINKILISTQAHGSLLKDIVKLAREMKIPVHHVPPEKIDSLSSEKTQGIIAEISPAEYLDIYSLIEKVKDIKKPLIVILDSIEDPHNLGAIIRNAVAFGADGVVIGKWHSANLTETVSRTSAGAIQHIPVARVTNIADTLNTLKKEGFWITGAENNNKSIRETEFLFPMALVIGSEGTGLRHLIKERCDILISIPQNKIISSLNASCASAVILYEISKSRNN